MGRWAIEDAGSHEKIVVLDDKLFAGGPERYMMDAHNADCDAYEKRIAELEAEQGRLRQIILDDGMELARVMAESLRVVPTEQHELGRWEVAMAAFIGGPTTIYERYDSDDGELVRLERWETEE